MSAEAWPEDGLEDGMKDWLPWFSSLYWAPVHMQPGNEHILPFRSRQGFS